MSSSGTPGASSVQIASFNEPSPASTYGGSACSESGDDFPATPNVNEAGGVTMRHLMRKVGKLSIKVEKSNESNSVERYSPPFVRNGAQGRIDDPFTSSVSPTNLRGSATTSAHRTPTGPKFINRATESTNWRSGSTSPTDTSSPSADKVARSGGRSVTVRDYAAENAKADPSRALLPIKPEDAQGHYAPSSCVFVANLLSTESDESLEASVLKAFKKYGTVFVKIRRDARQMPFAFCQYTNDRDAAVAIKEGRGTMISGRPCRCEKAKAHRLFFFERLYGEMLTCEEVEILLREFGKTSYCRPPTKLETSSYNLGDGVIVQFELYDEGQAALQHYRNHDEFKLRAMIPLMMSHPAAEVSADRLTVLKYDLERRSIYVGNLPNDTTVEDFHALFDVHGPITKVTIHKNDSIVNPSEQRCFAFIEFVSQVCVQAILDENVSLGFTLRGMVLRVAQKNTEAAVARAKQRGRPADSVESPLAPRQAPPVPLQASPYVNASPQILGSPFSSPAGYASYNPYIGYPGYAGGYPSPMYALNGQAYYGQYSPVPYSPTYNGPSVQSSQPAYYYPAYHQAFGMSPPTQQGLFQPYGQPAFGTGSPNPEDRSGTPTPAGRDSGFETLDGQ